MMKIEVMNGKANVYTPYNPDFVKKVKGIGGAKWNGSEKCWEIPETAIEAAREIMCEVFGYSDVKENETISLKITFNEKVEEPKSDVVLFGKILSHAKGRDTGAKVGDDVAYICGGGTSGGSVKNWYSIVRDGSVAILSNVNKSIYEREKIPYNVTVEVINESKSEKDLIEEKERLLKRIAEIEKILGEKQ